MNLPKSIRRIGFISAILLLIQLLVCGCGKEDTQGHALFWFTDPPERFHTNDVERAQREVPFTIILPTYAPGGIRLDVYMIEGPVRGACSEDKVRIRVTFATESGDCFVYILMLGRMLNPLPPSDSESAYLGIDGKRMLEYVTGVSVGYFSGGGEEIAGLSYTWNWDGVHFDVDVYGYDRAEARKIVESMIKQME